MRISAGVQTCALPIWYRSRTGNVWTGWQSLGGILTSEVAPVSWGAGRIDVFVREIGRASCRERVCQRVDLGGRRILKKKRKYTCRSTTRRQRSTQKLKSPTMSDTKSLRQNEKK